MTARLALASQRAIPGGAQRAVAWLAPELAALGWDVVGVVGEEGWLAEAWRANGIEVHRSVADAEPLDVVVSMGAATHAWAGAEAASLGIAAAWWLELTLRGRPAEAAALAVPAAFAAAPTDAATAALRARAPHLAVATIAPGVDPGPVAAHQVAGARLRAELDGDPLVVLVGRLDPAKGQDVAIAAIDQLAARHREAQLVLVGGAIVGHEGDIEARLRAAAGDRVTFTGHLADPGPWLAAADVVVVPSRHEAFGLVVVEALAHGARVVAADVDGPRAILAGGRHGWLVAPGDADALAHGIEAALADDQVAASGPARAQAFTPAAAAHEWDQRLRQ